jgi:hypothetical protein
MVFTFIPCHLTDDVTQQGVTLKLLIDSSPRYLNQVLTPLRSDIISIIGTLTNMNDSLQGKLSTVEGKLSAMEKKLSTMEENVGGRLRGLEIESMNSHIRSHNRRLPVELQIFKPVLKTVSFYLLFFSLSNYSAGSWIWVFSCRTVVQL